MLCILSAILRACQATDKCWCGAEALYEIVEYGVPTPLCGFHFMNR
ncbi:hypothetical protein [Marinactinospora rubrisoli]|uniref:Uncharacterized protein n=1 Tax=Marinactinospora rubrisoli TaxID=2715399 RepID=A0ABW2KNC6_9ACTN